MKIKTNYKIVRDENKKNPNEWGYWKMETFIICISKKHKFVATNIRLND